MHKQHISEGIKYAKNIVSVVVIVVEEEEKLQLLHVLAEK